MPPSDGDARLDGMLRQLERREGDGALAVQVADLATAIGRDEEALPAVERTARRIGVSAVLWQWTGVLARGADESARAAAAFAAAARLAPADARVAHGQARAALEGGLPADALFDRAIRLAPLDGEVLLGRAASRVAGGRLDRAVEELDAVLREHPGWLQGQETLARLRWLGGDPDGFTASVEAAIAGAPRDPALRQLLVGLLLRARLFARALEAAADGRAQAGPADALTGAEAIAWSELGEARRADERFAALGTRMDEGQFVLWLRHLLRTGRAVEAAGQAERRLAAGGSNALSPYLAIAWRLAGDARAEWLDGGDALVRTFDLSWPADRLAELGALLRRLHVVRHQHLGQSVRGGTQTDEPLFGRIEAPIRTLRAAVVEAIRSYLADLPPLDRRHPTLGPRRDRPIRFAGSWSVRLGPGGHHANHVHPMGWLSSAFYVALPGPSPDGDPQAGWLSLGEPDCALGTALPPRRLIEPRPGRLVLFPSTMWHGTRPFATDGERLTVAFDVAAPA